MKLEVVPSYTPLLGLKETERGIKIVKDFFEMSLAGEMRLRRVTAPLFVLKNLGINDDLNGIERPVSFPIKDMDNQEAEVVHSLAKWKRLALAELDIPEQQGLYTDMNAIRSDEELTNLHSLYVDQWDWEMVITSEQRTVAFLKSVVKRLYRVLRATEFHIGQAFPALNSILPEEVTFIYADDLVKKYPNLTPKEREDEAAKAFKAVFIIGIGGKMSDGTIHDGRAPDYDDWSTENEEGRIGLNGDIILWHPLLKRSFEISSMGIRVDKKALLSQLRVRGEEQRLELYWHKKLMADELPLSLGGGIGQSRLCMFLLQKVHIGEIQAGLWPEEMRAECRAHNIPLL